MSVWTDIGIADALDSTPNKAVYERIVQFSLVTARSDCEASPCVAWIIDWGSGTSGDLRSLSVVTNVKLLKLE